MDVDFDSFVRRAEKAEQCISQLSQEIKLLQKTRTDTGLESLQQCPELAKLLAENTKLKYRIGILKRATSARENPSKNGRSSSVKPADTDSSPSVLHSLTDIFREAIQTAFPDIGPDVPCPVTVSAKFADYQFNGAMSIAAILKDKAGVKVSPRDIGTKIVAHVKANDMIDHLEVAGPGFVNIFLSTDFLKRTVSSIMLHGVLPPPWQHLEGGKGRQRVIVDYSSPNIAKEMHVGHLRSTIIGDSIARLMQFLGHEVLRLNHVGDWGTQFGMLIAHLQDTYPQFKSQSPPIADLTAFYKDSKKRFDEDEEFKKRAYACVVKLQAHDPECISAWNRICDVSRCEFQKVYDRLDVSIEERGESFYQDCMNEVVQLLEQKGLLQEDNGRKVMFADNISVPLTIVKSDGGYTYDTSDMAAIWHRVHQAKADRVIYVTDLGQAPHFQTVFSCAQQAGIVHPDAVRLNHVGFGVVLGDDRKKFKTRSGDTVRLVELLDEGVRRAMEKLKEKGRLGNDNEDLMKTSEAIAYGCIKYADLSHNRHHEYVFSFDKMLQDKGNTAVYMLYAYTRIKSIARNAGVSSEQLAAACHDISMEHEKEIKLAKVLTRFPEVIIKIADDLFMHTLCEYMYDVATCFTEFYDACYCVEKDSEGNVTKINHGRLQLCEATARVLAKCFDILGLKYIDKM